MCLVIDTCCLSVVFQADAKRHDKFAPVLDWITEGKGRMIYGGTKYNDELGKTTKVLGIVSELSKQRKTIQLSNETVDPIATALKEKFPDPNFDDEHIVALVIASRCRVVCTDDNTAISYLKRADLFADYAGAARPSIYRGHKDHKKLCTQKYIAGICNEQV